MKENPLESESQITRLASGSEIEFLNKVAGVESIENLKGLLRNGVNLIEPYHLSMWGVDRESERIFFSEDLSSVEELQYSKIRVIDFGEGFLGNVVKKGDIQIRKPKSTTFLAREFIESARLKQVVGIPLLNFRNIQCAFLIGLCDHVFDDEIPYELIFQLTLFATQHYAIRSSSYRELALKIATEGLTVRSQNFFNNVAPLVLEYFDATTFSLWVSDRLEQPTLFCEYSTDEGLIGESYDSGEGATGGCFQDDRSVLVHRLIDLKKFGIEWKGKNPSIGLERSEHNHAIFMPIPVINDEGEIRKYGIARLVSSVESASFWPYDLNSFRTIAGLMAQRFNQDIFIDRLQDEKEKLSHLLKLTQNVLRFDLEERFDESAFDSLVEIFKADIVGLSFYRCNAGEAPTMLFCTDESLVYENLENALNREKTVLDGDKLYSLFGDKNGQTVYFLKLVPRESLDSPLSVGKLFISFISELDRFDLSYLALLRNILQVAWENSELYGERHSLLEKWERTEATQRAGIIAREFVHEIRNTIKSVQSWIGNSKDSKSRPKYEDLESSINTLAEFSDKTLQRSALTYNSAPCSVNALVKQTLRTFGVDLKRGTKLKGNSIEVRFDQRLDATNKLFVDVDPDAFVSVLRNLITNCIDQYERIRKTGKVEIHTELKKIGEGGGAVVVISVLDYAGGISPEIRKDMFKPFVTDKPEGAGVGLASVEGIVVGKMDGLIREVGEFGRMARFEVELDTRG